MVLIGGCGSWRADAPIIPAVRKEYQAEDQPYSHEGPKVAQSGRCAAVQRTALHGQMLSYTVDAYEAIRSSNALEVAETLTMRGVESESC
jgi:hypothetical protein